MPLNAIRIEIDGSLIVLASSPIASLPHMMGNCWDHSIVVQASTAIPLKHGTEDQWLDSLQILCLYSRLTSVTVRM